MRTLRIKFLAHVLLFCTCSISCHSPTFPVTLDDEECDNDLVVTEPTELIGYLVHNQQLEKACDLILEMKSQTPLVFHSDILHQIAHACIAYGLKDTVDDETLLSSLYAVALMHDDRAIDLLESHVLSSSPLIQLVACRVLATFDSEAAHNMLHRLLQSPFIPIRLEAAYHITQKHLPDAVDQLETLYWKSDDHWKPAITTLFGYEGSDRARDVLVRLLYDQNIDVRITALSALAEMKNKEHIAHFLTAIQDPDPRVQEALAYTLSTTSTPSSLARLHDMCNSISEEVVLQAAYALIKHGVYEYIDIIEQLAEDRNPYAIYLASLLAINPTPLLQDLDPTIALNAAYAILMQTTSAQITQTSTIFMDILIDLPKDLVIKKKWSLGNTLSCFLVTPISLEQNSAFAKELSKQEKETLLCILANRAPRIFLTIATQIFKNQCNDLVPLTAKLLENLGSQDATNLLLYGREQLGAPLIRTACNLSLFRMTQHDQYRTALEHWVMHTANQPHFLIRLPIPWDLEQKDTKQILTPEERSYLFLESLTTLAIAKDEQSVKQLVQLLKCAHPSNRPIIAALLSQCAR